VFRCRACDTANVDVVGGEELEVDTIDVVEEAQCTA
jgi:Zn finger protein HypA/HybF involved in hydrogenase expression